MARPVAGFGQPFAPFALPGRRDDIAAALSSRPDLLQQPSGNQALLRGLGGLAQGFLGASQMPGARLGTALLGGAAGLLPGMAQGQMLEQARRDQLRAQTAQQQAAAAKLRSEEQRAQARLAMDAAKQAEQTRQFEAKLPIEQQKANLGRFKTVGTDLFDVSGSEPRLAARGRRASEPLVPVFDPATGETRLRTRAQAEGQMAPPRAGMEVVTDPTTGQTIVRTGVTPGQGTELGTKARNKIEDQMIDLTAARERLGNIAATWQPEFSQLGSQLGMTFKEAQDRLGFLPDDQRQALAAYTQWQQTTRANLNRTIKEITGAAMTNAEASRIEGEVPNLSDGPTAFQAKLQNAVRMTSLAQARLSHLRNQGMPIGGNFGGIQLEEMPDIIDRRGAQIEQQLISQGMAPEVAEQQALAQVQQEFGI